MKNKNKINEPKLAAHIGYTISGILIDVGGALAVVAYIIMIYHISEENYTFKGHLTDFEQNIFMMIRYGVALVLGGLISMIGCACNIQKASEAGGTGEKICDLCSNSVNKLQKAVIGDETIHICSECAKKSLSDDQNTESDS